MIRTEGLTHVHLIVSDLARSVRFYSSVFGMEEQFREGETMVFLRTPGAKDTITLNAQPGAKQIGRGGVDHIGFRLIDKRELEAAIREVEGATEGLSNVVSTGLDSPSLMWPTPMAM